VNHESLPGGALVVNSPSGSVREREKEREREREREITEDEAARSPPLAELEFGACEGKTATRYRSLADHLPESHL